MALRPRRPTRALRTARQVFAAPVPLFDLPTHGTGSFPHWRRHRLLKVLGKDPGKGAVSGDPLAQPPVERDFLPLDPESLG